MVCAALVEEVEKLVEVEGGVVLVIGEEVQDVFF